MTGKSVLTLSATRWGSCVDVLERYFEHSQALQVIANKKGWDCPSEYEIQYLNAVYEILLPFAEILQEVQAKNSVTISKCFGYVKALLMSFEEEEVTLVSEEKDGLRKSLLKRFSRIIDSKEAGFNPIYVMAAALDPNTADHLTDEDLEIVVDSLGNLLPTSMVEPQPEIEEMPQSSISILLAKVSSINKKKRKAVHQAQEERKGSIRLLLRALCSENFGIKNPLHYWHGLMKSKMHAVATLALEILAVPATSAPIERIFSQAGIATCRHRNRTEFSLLNSQLLIYCNKISDSSVT